MSAAIPTTINGVQYRSRLEAKWATFFGHLGWRVEYEPIDGNGYIPDFVIYGNRPVMVEVKPATTIADLQPHVDKVTSGLTGEWEYDILIVGAGIDLPPGRTYPDCWHGQFPSIGWFGQYNEWDDGPSWVWSYGLLITCLECSQFAILHDEMSYGGRPCWCVEGGDGHIGRVNTRLLNFLWNEASAAAKWTPR